MVRVNFNISWSTMVRDRYEVKYLFAKHTELYLGRKKKVSFIKPEYFPSRFQFIFSLLLKRFGVILRQSS